jgi:hypothetical protein
MCILLYDCAMADPESAFARSISVSDIYLAAAPQTAVHHMYLRWHNLCWRARTSVPLQPKLQWCACTCLQTWKCSKRSSIPGSWWGGWAATTQATCRCAASTLLIGEYLGLVCRPQCPQVGIRAFQSHNTTGPGHTRSACVHLHPPTGVVQRHR